MSSFDLSIDSIWNCMMISLSFYFHLKEQDRAGFDREVIMSKIEKNIGTVISSSPWVDPTWATQNRYIYLIIRFFCWWNNQISRGNSAILQWMDIFVFHLEPRKYDYGQDHLLIRHNWPWENLIFVSIVVFLFCGFPSGGANVAQFQSFRNQSEGTDSISQTFYICTFLDALPSLRSILLTEKKSLSQLFFSCPCRLTLVSDY